MGVGPRIVLAVNSAWNIVTFRAGLVRALIENGYDVVAVAPPDRHVPRVVALGCRFVPLPMQSAGTHPIHELVLLFRYWRILKNEKPDAYLGFTIKPNVYGSLAAAALHIPVINNIAGLGTTFLRGGWLNRTARILYRAGLSRSALVFFQNQNDLDLFVSLGLARQTRARRVSGSGVNTGDFSPRPRKRETGASFRFLLLGRLLWDKGVREYIEAARRLKSTNANTEAFLLGFVDSNNPSAISKTQIQAWEQEGVATYLGEADDVRPCISSVDCVVLPSYREGIPRALLEAASMGKPIITTDAPGCRDVVKDGITGYVVPVKDVERLYDAMTHISTLPEGVLEQMGGAGRALVEAQFKEERVISAYLTALTEITRDCCR